MSSALDVDVAPAPSSTDPDDCLDHLSCCRDDNVALCSADLTAAEWAARDAFTDPCVVCFDLETADIFCPHSGTPAPPAPATPGDAPQP
jgi:hypothetical protein